MNFKKLMSFLVCLCLLVSIASTAVFAEDVSLATSTVKSVQDFQYKITPASAEWKNHNPMELKKMLNIPAEDLQNMDTETLLNIVLDYPYLGDIYAFDDPLKAIDYISDQFNGLNDLLGKEDLKDKLMASYIDSTNEIIKLKDNEKLDNNKRYKHNYRESLLAYSKVFNKLDTKEKATVESISKKVADKIDTHSINVKYPDKFTSTETHKAPVVALLETTLTASREPSLKIPFNILLAAAGDIIKTGSVMTPNLSIVSVFEREEMSSSDKASADAYIASTYPNATKLSSASFKYNCHSYAWYSASTSNTWWMNDPSKYMSDGSYSKQTTATSGMKIYYYAGHSGIISSVSGSNKIIKSKWGAYGLYSHGEYYCPYTNSPVLNTYWKR